MQVILGLLLSTVFAVAAFVRGSLTVSGALAAAAIGTAIYAGGGITWWLVLFTFFLTSTLLGRVGQHRKSETKTEFSKGDQRDLWQVVANGGIAALAALMYVRNGDSIMWMGAFVGALAACNADTWATELGILSRGEPVSVTTFRRMPRGTSGAISVLGTVAAMAGGAAIGAVAGAFANAFHSPALNVPTMTLIGVAAGLLGSLLDSVLGSTVQANYGCPICDSHTEQRIHHCGATTQHVRGFGFMNNDLVNLCASGFGAAVAALAVFVLT